MEALTDYNKFLPWENDISIPAISAGPDDRSGRVYLYDPKLQLAAEIAIEGVGLALDFILCS